MKNRTLCKLSVVIPLFNEEMCVEKIICEILRVLDSSDYMKEIWLVDDGSDDNTPNLLTQLEKQYKEVNWIRLTRNFGHQAALKAGLDCATGDCVVMMDGDMQHPPSVIPQLIAIWESGFDIVATRRVETGKVPFLKLKTSRWFYKLLHSLSEVAPEPGMADFRLIDKKVVQVLSSLPEVELFFRGLVEWSGFSTSVVDYEVGSRWAGKTKYSLRKMIKLAVSGITGFSSKPLYLSIYLGGILSFFSMLYLCYAIYQYLVGETVWGWTSLMMVILLLGGMQFLLIGVIGIYLSKVFNQVKQRPVYIVQSRSKRNEE